MAVTTSDIGNTKEAQLRELREADTTTVGRWFLIADSSASQAHRIRKPGPGGYLVGRCGLVFKPGAEDLEPASSSTRCTECQESDFVEARPGVYLPREMAPTPSPQLALLAGDDEPGATTDATTDLLEAADDTGALEDDDADGWEALQADQAAQEATATPAPDDAEAEPIEDVDDAPLPAADADEDDLVQSADGPLWRRWLVVRSEALDLGLPVAELRLPLPRAGLTAKGQQVLEQIAARRAELAQQDLARADGAVAHQARGRGDKVRAAYGAAADVACPTCKAKPGQWCKRPSGHQGPMVGCHAARNALTAATVQDQDALEAEPAAAAEIAPAVDDDVAQDEVGRQAGMQDSAQPALGPDAKGRMWRTFQNGAGTWGLSYRMPGDGTWRMEQYGRTYPDREAALERYRTAWAPPAAPSPAPIEAEGPADSLPTAPVEDPAPAADSAIAAASPLQDRTPIEIMQGVLDGQSATLDELQRVLAALQAPAPTATKARAATPARRATASPVRTAAKGKVAATVIAPDGARFEVASLADAASKLVELYPAEAQRCATYLAKRADGQQLNARLFVLADLAPKGQVPAGAVEL